MERFIQQLEDHQSVSSGLVLSPSTEPSSTRGPNRILDFLKSLWLLDSDSYQGARLNSIVNMVVNTNDKEAVFQSLAEPLWRTVCQTIR